MKKSVFGCLLAIGMFVASAVGALAVGAQSAHYTVPIDAVASGGGASASAHYQLLDSSVGQDSPAGISTIPTRIDTSGVIQYWPYIKNAANSWTLYN